MDANDSCYKVVKVVITATLENGAGTMTTAQALDQLYDNSTTSVNIYAKPAGQALIHWIASSAPSDSEKTALYGSSLATSETGTALALVDGGGTASWTRYLAVAVRTKNTDETLDTSSDHTSNGFTVKTVEAIS